MAALEETRLLALDAETCRVLVERGFTLNEVRSYLAHRVQADLRDQFAMAALRFNPMSPGWQSNAAWEAYSVADAMLRERAK